MTTIVDTAGLIPHPHNARYWTQLPETSDKYQVLQGSIELRGIEVPLKVQSGTNFVLSGNTRLRIALSLKMPTVPVDFLAVDDNEAEKILVRENFERRPDEKNPMKIARQIGVMRDTFGMNHSSERVRGRHSAGEIAAGFNIGKSQYFDYLRLLELIEPLQERVESGVLGVSGGSALARLSSDVQMAVFEKMLGYTGKRWTAKVVKKFCDAVTGKEKVHVMEYRTSPKSRSIQRKDLQLDLLTGLLQPEEAIQYGTDMLQSEIDRYRNSITKMKTELYGLSRDCTAADESVKRSAESLTALLEEVLDIVRTNLIGAS